MDFMVRSRPGNIALGVLGMIYAVGAPLLLVYSLVQTWGAASAVDSAIQFVLLICSLTGLLFAVIAARSLRLGLRRRGAPLHRAAPEAAR